MKMSQSHRAVENRCVLSARLKALSNRMWMKYLNKNGVY